MNNGIISVFSKVIIICFVAKLTLISPNLNSYSKIASSISNAVNNSYVDNGNKSQASEVKSLTINSFEDLFKNINNLSTYKLSFSDEKIEKTYDKAKEIVSSITNFGMSEFEKEKAIHDYIIANVKLEEAKDGTTKNAYDVIVENNGDPYSYAEAIKLLLNLSGIECEIVNGEYGNGEEKVKHVWDIVKIDGQYYHLDTALDNNLFDDDSRNDVSKMTYNYFNLSDTSIDENHSFDTTKYPAATNTNSDFVVKLLNNMINNPALYVIKGYWIYYADDSSNGSLSKCKVDGTNNIKISEDTSDVTEIEISGNSLYYASDYIYKLNFDGSAKTKISDYPIKDGSIKAFEINNNSIYYLENPDPDENLFCIDKKNLESGEKTQISDILPIYNYFDVKNSGIYFCLADDNNSGLYKLDLSGNQRIQLIDGLPLGINIDGDLIYYTIIEESPILNDSGVQVQKKTTITNYKIKIDGTNKETIGEPYVTVKDVTPN